MSEPSASWMAMAYSGVKSMQCPVEVGAEGHAVLVDPAQVAQADHLEATRIGEDGSIPLHELMQTTEALDAFVSGAEREMVGVREDDARPDLSQVVGVEGLDGGVRADGHEDGRLDHTVGRLQAAGSCAAALGIGRGQHLEADGCSAVREVGHCVIWARQAATEAMTRASAR